ncbi:hypothetical protein KEM54_002532 [Ascosphaera aggregata]|nr:hypothetical protein KEM54_002532 [Ascosphaera aggregata]
MKARPRLPKFVCDAVDVAGVTCDPFDTGKGVSGGVLKDMGKPELEPRAVAGMLVSVGAGPGIEFVALVAGAAAVVVDVTIIDEGLGLGNGMVVGGIADVIVAVGGSDACLALDVTDDAVELIFSLSPIGTPSSPFSKATVEQNPSDELMSNVNPSLDQLRSVNVAKWRLETTHSGEDCWVSYTKTTMRYGRENTGDGNIGGIGGLGCSCKSSGGEDRFPPAVAKDDPDSKTSLGFDDDTADDMMLSFIEPAVDGGGIVASVE